MDPVSKLRRKNAGAFAPGHRAAQLSAFLPKVQAGEHHQRPKLSCYKNQSSAGRKDAVLTARIVCGWNCVFFTMLHSPKSKNASCRGSYFERQKGKTWLQVKNILLSF